MFKNVKDGAEETLTDGEVEQKLIKNLLKFPKLGRIGSERAHKRHKHIHTDIQAHKHTSTQTHKHTNTQTNKRGWSRLAEPPLSPELITGRAKEAASRLRSARRWAAVAAPAGGGGGDKRGASGGRLYRLVRSRRHNSSARSVRLALVTSRSRTPRTYV